MFFMGIYRKVVENTEQNIKQFIANTTKVFVVSLDLNKYCVMNLSKISSVYQSILFQIHIKINHSPQKKNP